MKKALGLLFISTSMFSMQLAHRIQAPRFIKQSIATVNMIAKDITSEVTPIVCNTPIEFNTPKFKIDSASFRAPHYMADTQLYHGKKGFVVVQDGEKQIIEKVLMDKTAREITKKNLKPFLKSGFLVLNQTGDGKFTLKAHHRLNGGGPIFGSIMYWVTKSLCYGTAAAAAGGAIVATGGAVAGAMASTVTAAAVGGAVATNTAATVAAGKVTAAIITTAKVSTVGTSIASTTGVVTAGAGMAGTVATGAGTAAVAIGAADALGVTVAGVGVAKAAAITTAAGVTAASSTGAAASVGTGAAIIMGIESLSVAVGTFFGMLPTP